MNNNDEEKDYVSIEDSMICDVINICKIYYEKKNNIKVKLNNDNHDPTYVDEIHDFIYNKIIELNELTETNEIDVIDENDFKDDNFNDYYILLIDSKKFYSKSLMSLFIHILLIIKDKNYIDWNIIDKK